MRFVATTVGIIGIFASGCSAADGQTTSEPDRAQLDGELGSVTQNLGEATCGNIPADETWDFSGLQAGAGTASGSYGHPQCTDGYVVDVLNVPANNSISGGMTAARWPDPFTCLFNWGYVSLWRQGPSGYVKISEASSLGVWGGLPQIGNVCFARGTVKVPAAGNYRVVAAAGVLFGPKGPVSITR